MSKFPKTALFTTGPKETDYMKISFYHKRRQEKKIPIKNDGIDQRIKAIKEQTGKMGNKIREKCMKLSHSPQGVLHTSLKEGISNLFPNS